MFVCVSYICNLFDKINFLLLVNNIMPCRVALSREKTHIPPHQFFLPELLRMYHRPQQITPGPRCAKAGMCYLLLGIEIQPVDFEQLGP